ncbi:hypothetical protein BN844_5017 [Pseudomonas sp. SHC52]|nr:hypothetical protein BN844_5017 [Pseudomonas sp. SHC52]
MNWCFFRGQMQTLNRAFARGVPGRGKAGKCGGDALGSAGRRTTSDRRLCAGAIRCATSVRRNRRPLMP